MKDSNRCDARSSPAAAPRRRQYCEFGGSIKAQKPFFRAPGLDLSAFPEGTINADIKPHRFLKPAPLLTVNVIKWHPDMPAEIFSFASAMIGLGSRLVPAFT